MSDFEKCITFIKEESWERKHSTVEEDYSVERTEFEEGEALDSSAEDSSFCWKHGRDLVIINEVSENVKNFPLTEANYCKSVAINERVL